MHTIFRSIHIFILTIAITIYADHLSAAPPRIETDVAICDDISSHLTNRAITNPSKFQYYLCQSRRPEEPSGHSHLFLTTQPPHTVLPNQNIQWMALVGISVPLTPEPIAESEHSSQTNMDQISAAESTSYGFDSLNAGFNREWRERNRQNQRGQLNPAYENEQPESERCTPPEQPSDSVSIQIEEGATAANEEQLVDELIASIEGPAETINYQAQINFLLSMLQGAVCDGRPDLHQPHQDVFSIANRDYQQPLLGLAEQMVEAGKAQGGEILLNQYRLYRWSLFQYEMSLKEGAVSNME